MVAESNSSLLNVANELVIATVSQRPVARRAADDLDDRPKKKDKKNSQRSTSSDSKDKKDDYDKGSLFYLLYTILVFFSAGKFFYIDRAENRKRKLTDCDTMKSGVHTTRLRRCQIWNSNRKFIGVT